MTVKRGPGRYCSVCGEPVKQHGLRTLSAAQRVLLTRTARSRAAANAQIRAAQRVCPLTPVATPEGAPPRWAPQRLVDAGLLDRAA